MHRHPMFADEFRRAVAIAIADARSSFATSPSVMHGPATVNSRTVFMVPLSPAPALMCRLCRE